jgi:hypothetical protein
MGRQYVRQSFSNASCAAGDSPCASSTTLQCVVVNATPPSCLLAIVAVVEVTSSGAGVTIRSKEKITLKASLKDYAHSAFRVFRNAERQQGMTAWATSKAFGAGKPSLLDSGFDTQRISMLIHDAK